MNIKSLTSTLILSVFMLPFTAVAGDIHAHPSADISTEISATAVHAGDQATVAVIVTVHDGLHAQSNTPFDEYAIKFEVAGDKIPGVQFGNTIYPPAKELTLPELGRLSVYQGKTVILLPVSISADAKPGPLKISGQMTYQACNDSACFGPENPVFEVTTKVVSADQTVGNNPAFPDVKVPQHASTKPMTAPAMIMPTNSGGTTVFGFDLDKSTWPLAFTSAFVIGVIFNLMPCVLPVLPLKNYGIL